MTNQKLDNLLVVFGAICIFGALLTRDADWTIIGLLLLILAKD